MISRQFDWRDNESDAGSGTKRVVERPGWRRNSQYVNIL